MSFASLEFGLFFALVFAIYCALSHRGQNGFLLGASYVFYAAWDWRFVFLLLLSTVVDFSVGRALSQTNDERRRRNTKGATLERNRKGQGPMHTTQGARHKAQGSRLKVQGARPKSQGPYSGN